MTPDFVFSTIPSGSTRLTVASLYSLPFNVLKSSAKTVEMKERIEKVSTFVLIVELMGVAFLLCYFGLVRSRRIPGEVVRSITLSLSKANHGWSNSPERSGLIDQRFFSRDRGIGVKV